jgi:hypothetical protein
MPSFSQVHEKLEPLRVNLLAHPLYRHMEDVRALEVFMQHHVFAVWDFMSLLKALQQRLCSVAVPWLPPVNREGCRLVNEIVLAEESDQDGAGGYASHFDLYRDAMQNCAFKTTTIDRFLQALGAGASLEAALEQAEAPQPVREFVRDTFAVIDGGNLCAIASAFAYGREDLLPDLFRQIVERLHAESGSDLAAFKYYLERHIDLDGDTHGPMAGRLVEFLCGDSAENWQAAEEAAVRALEARLRLWDAIDAAVVGPTNSLGTR